MRNLYCGYLVGILALTAGASYAETTLTIATVDNPDMQRMQRLSEAYTAEHPDVKLEWVVLEENTLRQRATTDIATGAGRFDIVSIGTYEAPIWAERGWLSSLSNMPEGYNVEDLLPTIRESLSYDGELYAAPFYGESSLTIYRKDLFDAAGLQMPEQPDWNFIKEAAAKIDALEGDAHGICLRGKPGWGENIALLTAMANSYGGSWFNNDWQPQLNSEAWVHAVTDYVTMLSKYGPENATELGYLDNLQLFKDGKCGIWIDATVAASAVTDPDESTVADQVGFALAPTSDGGKGSNWLWSWALGVSAASEHQDAAKDFVAWATSADYIELVAQNEGWANVPPGTRKSLYANPAYLEAAPFAEKVLASIQASDPSQPAVSEVPYTGIQYVSIPEFPGIGTAVGVQISKALAGDIEIGEAIENAQWVTSKVIDQARFIAGE